MHVSENGNATAFFSTLGEDRKYRENAIFLVCQESTRRLKEKKNEEKNRENFLVLNREEGRKGEGERSRERERVRERGSVRV